MSGNKRKRNDSSSGAPPAHRTNGWSAVDHSQLKSAVPFPNRIALLEHMKSLMDTQAEIDFCGAYVAPKGDSMSDSARCESLLQDIQSLGGYQWLCKDRPTLKGGYKYRLTCSLASTKLKKETRDSLPSNTDKSVTWNGQKFYHCHGTLTMISKTEKGKTSVSIALKHKQRHARPPPPADAKPLLPDPTPEVQEEAPQKQGPPKPKTDYERVRKLRAARQVSANAESTPSSACPTPTVSPPPRSQTSSETKPAVDGKIDEAPQTTCPTAIAESNEKKGLTDP